MEFVDKICIFLITTLGIFNIYQILYFVVGFFSKAKKFSDTNEEKSYAIIIAARNEEKVVGNLIKSIKLQDYPKEKITVFVVADNCSDKTAEICRELNAIVYERKNPEKARKGYALEFLFDKIKCDYDEKAFDGFFIFDADNLLHPNFIKEMNKAFVFGYDVVTSYRNTKNFETNFISASYGIHFYKNSLSKHRPRSVLNIGTHLTGTGYLFKSELIKNGWDFTNLTEDDEFTINLTKKGVKIGYCEAAEFYDEQPCDVKTVVNQRIRWAKGRLTAFFKYCKTLFSSIFRHKSFTSYDMFFHYFPYPAICWILGIIYPLLTIFCGLFIDNSYNFAPFVALIFTTLATQYLTGLFYGFMTVIREREHINCKFIKAVKYCFFYPWFDILSVYFTLISVFSSSKWKPIKHVDSREIKEMFNMAKK